MVTTTNYSGELAALLEPLRAHAHAEAAANRPANDAKVLDQHEAAVVSEGQKWMADEQRLFGSAMTESTRALVETDQKVIELDTRVDQLLRDSSLVGTVDQELASVRPRLVAASERRMRAELDYKYFRAQHRIRDQAHYPESRIMHLAIIAVLALVEVGVNAFFYENEQGLLGGFVVALGVSVMTMAAATGLGSFFRYKNLANPDKKVLGWSCLVAFVLWTIYCNALFAAFRSHYQTVTDPSDPRLLREAFRYAAADARHVFTLRMQFKDFMSFILFGLGIVLSSLAFFKGYTLDDRYPGHGQKDRELKTRQGEWDAELELARQKVREVAHVRRSDLQAALHEFAQLIGRLARQTSDLKHARAFLSTQTQSIQRDLTLALNTYRSANKAVRVTPAPEYFERYPDLLATVSDAAADPVLARIAELQEKLAAGREKSQDAINEKIREFTTEATSLLTKTLQEFVRDVEKEAEQRLDKLSSAPHLSLGVQ